MLSSNPVGDVAVILSQSEPAEESYERAWAYYRAGNYARCRELADRLLADHGADDAGLTLKGMALAELDRPEEAVEAFRLAVQIRPDNEEAWAQLGTALVTEGHLAEAAESFRAALRIRRDNYRAMVDLSNVLFILGQVDEAIATLEEARRTRRGDLGILRNLAEMYASDGQSEKALATTLEILDLQPGDVLARCDAAWLLLALNRPDEAGEMFRSLRRTDPEQDHELHAIHGLVIVQIRRRDWRRALNLAIEATRLDRYDFTTALLAYISSRLFDQQCAVTEQELNDRFELEHREHRRLHAEAVV